MYIIRRTSCLKQKNLLTELCSSAIHKYQNSQPWHRDTSSHKHCTSALNSTRNIISNCLESFNWNWQSLTDSSNSLPFAEPESSLFAAILYDPTNGPHQEPVRLHSTPSVQIYTLLLFKLLRTVSFSKCFLWNYNHYYYYYYYCCCWCNTSTHVTKTPTEFPTQPHITKPTHTQPHITKQVKKSTLQNTQQMKYSQYNKVHFVYGHPNVPNTFVTITTFTSLRFTSKQNHVT